MAPRPGEERIAPPPGEPVTGPAIVEAPSITALGEVTDRAAVFHSLPVLDIPGPFERSRPIPARPEGSRPRHDGRAGDPTATAATIWVPRGACPGDGLPVIAHVHGGAYEAGSHESPRIDGAPHAERGVVLVSIGYRLGLEGFLRLPGEPPARYRGIDDARATLTWLRENIAAFGGDPDNVTLMGQSAGAGVALWLAREDHLVPGVRPVPPLSPAFPRVPAHRRRAALPLAVPGPRRRAALTRALARRPRRVRAGYRLFTRTHPFDLQIGPAPFDAGALAALPLIVTVTHDECQWLPTALRRPTMRWLDEHPATRAALAPAARGLGLRVPFGEYLAALPEADRNRPWVSLASDAIIRRWAAHALEGARGEAWLVEYRGTEDKPARHSDDLDLVFGKAPGPASTRVIDGLAALARGGRPSWPAYTPGGGRKALSFSLASGEAEVIADPLRAARVGFGTPPPRD